MDPLSIAGNSAALKASCHEVCPVPLFYSTPLKLIAFKIISYTTSIIQDKVPDSDRTIANLGRDLHEVSNILDQLNFVWRSHAAVLMTHPSASFGMWPNLQNILESVRITLQGLRNGVEPVVNSGRKKTFFKVHAKAWNLGTQMDSISKYRGLLNALHKALKVGVNMWVSPSGFNQSNMIDS